MRASLASGLFAIVMTANLVGQPRTLKAVNFGHRASPVKIGLTGTVLLPDADGRATVRGRGGVTEVNVKITGLRPPGRFGPQQLTYVLWAITPQGRPVSLAELVPNYADRAQSKISTPLQSFALVVTAEPYAAVTSPSGIVVLENQLPGDARFAVEEVAVTDDLFPPYTFDPDAQKAAEGPMVSMDEYEAISALYQAQNALQIAEAEGVNHAAPEAFSKAVQLYQQAFQLRVRKESHKQVTAVARQSAQATEDARAIAQKRTTGQ